MMSRALANEVLRTLAESNAGLSAREILTSIDSPPIGNRSSSIRTIQRTLQSLITEGKVEKTGTGKSTRYHLIQSSKNIELSRVISEAGQLIQRNINKELSDRPKAIYNDDFLQQYVPNKTFYLPENLRVHLAKIGKQKIADQPGATFTNKILNQLLVDLPWNSSRLEGNTYSLLDTKRLVEQGEEAEGKSTFETRMILNHKEAIEYLVDLGPELGFERNILLNLHGLLSYNLLPNPSSSGKLRTIPVSIGGSRYEPHMIAQFIEEKFNLILKKIHLIQDAYEQSFFIMVHIPYLQPFVDVNKRVSRIAANIPFINTSYCPISFIDVPKKDYIDGLLGIYELNKIELLRDIYVWAYERSTDRYSEAKAYLIEPDQFVESYDAEIKLLIRLIVTQTISQKESYRYISKWSKKHISEQDQQRFIEHIENELISLHEGNIARYKVKLSEYRSWQTSW